MNCHSERVQFSGECILVDNCLRLILKSPALFLSQLGALKGFQHLQVKIHGYENLLSQHSIFSIGPSILLVTSCDNIKEVRDFLCMC